MIELLLTSKKRSEAWRKVIHWHHQDVVLTGIRKEDGAWLVGVESGGQIRPAGVIEFPPGDRYPNAECVLHFWNRMQRSMSF